MLLGCEIISQKRLLWQIRDGVAVGGGGGGVVLLELPTVCALIKKRKAAPLSC